MADPVDGVWNVTEVDEVLVCFGIWEEGPRWNLLDHHFCSDGSDSVGFDLEAVAKVIDLVVGAWSDLRFIDVLNDVMVD